QVAQIVDQAQQRRAQGGGVRVGQPADGGAQRLGPALQPGQLDHVAAAHGAQRQPDPGRNLFDLAPRRLDAAGLCRSGHSSSSANAALSSSSVPFARYTCSSTAATATNASTGMV